MALWIRTEDGSVEKAAGGGGDAGPHDHAEYAPVEHDHDEFTHDHDYLPLAGGALTGDLYVDGTLTVGTPLPANGKRSILLYDNGGDSKFGFAMNPGRVSVIAMNSEVFSVHETAGARAHTDLQVDGKVVVNGGTGAPVAMKSVAGRRILQLQPDDAATPTLFLHGDNDASTDTMSVKGSNGNYMIRLHGGGLFQVFGEIQDQNGPVRSFAIAGGINTADILNRAETATMPVIDEEGVATADADVEGLTVNEVVTALLLKVKELSAEIEELKGA